MTVDIRGGAMSYLTKDDLKDIIYTRVNSDGVAYYADAMDTEGDPVVIIFHDHGRNGFHLAMMLGLYSPEEAVAEINQLCAGVEYLVTAFDARTRQSWYGSFCDYDDALGEYGSLINRPDYTEVSLSAGGPAYWRTIKEHKRDERLTRWNGTKWVLPQGQWREIAEKLARYEDIDPSPERLAEIVKQG